MSLYVGGTQIKRVLVNGAEMYTLVANGGVVWRRMRDWAYTAGSTTVLNDICEYRIDHEGLREPYVDSDKLFGTAINSIQDGESIAIVIVSYGQCCSTGMRLQHNGVSIPARAYNYGSPSYNPDKTYWTVSRINDLDTSLCSRPFYQYGQMTYHGLETKTSSTSSEHILDKYGNDGRHYNWGTGCSDAGKGGWSAYILHGESFSYLLNRLGLRNTPNSIRTN